MPHIKSAHARGELLITVIAQELLGRKETVTDPAWAASRVRDSFLRGHSCYAGL